MQSMSLTEDESEYIDLVRDRAIRQIDIGVWDGMQKSRLQGWLGSLKNFDGELLGAYLLDNLCYRSRDQFMAMLDALFVDIAMPGGKPEPLLIDALKFGEASNRGCGVRIAPVIGHLAPPTKSGPFILRLAQRRYKLHNDWLVWPHLLEQTEAVTDLYFVDDFCGTGEQFVEFLKGIRFDQFFKAHPSLKVTYLVTTIHECGLNRIRKDYPDVQLKWTEFLDGTNAVLEAPCLDRYEVPGFADKIGEQYAHVVKSMGLPQRGKLADGFGGLALAYAFAHSTPNNTLPIFWMERPQLTPLLDR
jgi:hypothetical protein